MNELCLAITDCLQRKGHPARERFVPDIDEQDVSSSLLEELRQMEPWLNKVASLRKFQEETEEDCMADVINDPTYHPEDEEGDKDKDDEKEEEEDDEEPSTLAKRPMKVPSSKSGKQPAKTATNPAAKLVITNDQEPSTSARRPLEDPASPASKRTKTTMEKSDTGSSTKKRRSHHKKCKCLFCSKEVFDLKRHLRMQEKNEDIDEVDVHKSFSIAVNTTKRRGSRRPGNRKGLPLKWCPVEDCSYVTALLQKHLMNNHSVKAGTYFDNLLKVARLYKGKEEVDDLPLVKQGPETRSPQQQQPVDKEPEVSVEEVKEDQEEPSSDLEDEDYEEDQLQEQYFTSANPKTTQHKWLVLFY